MMREETKWAGIQSSICLWAAGLVAVSGKSK